MKCAKCSSLRGLSYVKAKPEATEEFEVLQVAPAELEAMIADEKIWDGMTLAAWLLVRKRFIK